MADNEDSLVRRRPKRSTAGNRMEAALAELALQNLEPELEDDADYAGLDDEAEIFDSDFQSTDEEEAQEDEAAGEKQILEEEKQNRRVLRQRAARVEGQQPKDLPGPQVKKGVRRRVSLGVAIDAETGEIVGEGPKRKSRRQSTMLSTQNLHTRLRDAQERKAAMPKREKETIRTYTQAELISRALDTEEGNILEHRNYLYEEEEKRKRAKVLRKVVSGPVLRSISKIGEDKITVAIEHPPPPPQPTYPPPYSVGVFQSAPPNANGGFVEGAPSSSNAVPPEPPAEQQTRMGTKKVTRNYLVHELGQQEGTPKPRWDETMTAVFGDHVKWDEVKVYTTRHRPLARPHAICPITGRRALYRDPRSGVPFANVSAFKTLTRVLAHEYVWDGRLGCYTAAADQVGYGQAKQEGRIGETA